MDLITMANLISWSAIISPLIVSADILLCRTPTDVKLNMICGCTALLRILNGKPLNL